VSQKSLTQVGFVIYEILVERFLKYYPGLYQFAGKTIDFSQINHSEAAVVNSPEFLDLDIINDASVRLFINLHTINDIRWINRYFLEVHKRLINGGYFLGRANTIDIHKRQFFKKYPKYFAEFVYIFHFVFFRVFCRNCPKSGRYISR